MKRCRAYLTILITLLAQMLLSSFLPFSGITPNLMVISLIFFALFSGEKRAFELGLLCGLLLDALSIRFFGLNTVLFACAGCLIGRYNRIFYRTSVVTHAILIFVTSWVMLSVSFFAASLRQPPMLQGSGVRLFFAPGIILSSLLNAFLGVWIIAFLSRAFRIDEKVT